MTPEEENRDAIRALMMAFGCILLALLGLALSMCASGCAASKPTVVDHVVTVTVKERCATVPPPTFRSVARPTVCAPGVICYKAPDASDLAENVERALEWIRATWALCAPPVTK